MPSAASMLEWLLPQHEYGLKQVPSVRHSVPRPLVISSMRTASEVACRKPPSGASRMKRGSVEAALREESPP
jgi:hypothetical protein